MFKLFLLLISAALLYFGWAAPYIDTGFLAGLDMGRPFFFTLFLLIYFLATLLSFFLGDFLGLYGIFLTMLSSILLFWAYLASNFGFFLIEGGFLSLNVSPWLRLFDSLDVGVSLQIDAVSFSFLFLTITIALFVNAYAFSYFRYEPNVERLVILLNSFVLSMCLLVMSANLVLLFLGWELIGLTSFLLINFWQTRVGTLKAAFKAYTFNKVSDAALLLGTCAFFAMFGDLNLACCNSLAIAQNNLSLNHIFCLRLVEVGTACFLISAFVKSAQIGLHVWLPDSREAPVPASALIHSATLVSAGVFLALRLQPIFELSSLASTLLPLVGSVTALVGGFSALYQTDLKRVLAYSTISHCGFLFVLASLGLVEFTLLYLVVHGFFKASSFLCVGNVIRFSKSYQDSRRMGSFWKYLPFELFFLFFCLANLSGLPLFLGFSVKHLVLASASGGLYNLFVASFSLLAAFSGLFYSYKIFYYVFFDSKKSRKSVYFSYAMPQNASIYYSNTTLASNVSIALLVVLAYLFCFLMAYNLVFYPYNSFAELSRQLDMPLNCMSGSLDHSLSFNFKLLNCVVLVLFFFLNFFCWSSSNYFSFSLVTSLLLVILLA